MLLWYYHENSADMVYRIELSNSFKLSELTRAMLAIYEENLLVEQKSWNSRRRHRTLSIKYLFYFFLTRILFKNQRGSFQVTFYNCLFLVFGSVEDPYDCFVLFFIYLTFQVTSLKMKSRFFLPLWFQRVESWDNSSCSTADKRGVVLVYSWLVCLVTYQTKHNERHSLSPFKSGLKSRLITLKCTWSVN